MRKTDPDSSTHLVFSEAELSDSCLHRYLGSLRPITISDIVLIPGAKGGAASTQVPGGGRKEKMPVVMIDIIEGVFSKEQKDEMMRRVSEVVAEIECRPDPKENMLPFVYCIT